MVIDLRKLCNFW